MFTSVLIYFFDKLESGRKKKIGLEGQTKKMTNSRCKNTAQPHDMACTAGVVFTLSMFNCVVLSVLQRVSVTQGGLKLQMGQR